jgi:hypothetical protein
MTSCTLRMVVTPPRVALMKKAPLLQSCSAGTATTLAHRIERIPRVPSSASHRHLRRSPRRISRTCTSHRHHILIVKLRRGIRYGRIRLVSARGHAVFTSDPQPLRLMASKLVIGSFAAVSATAMVRFAVVDVPLLSVTRTATWKSPGALTFGVPDKMPDELRLKPLWQTTQRTPRVRCHAASRAQRKAVW